MLFNYIKLHKNNRVKDVVFVTDLKLKVHFYSSTFNYLRITYVLY